jgi:3-deoxy-D-manno-octulosonate 8-phosphate phosphatase (KDO 8-P phosphatase)
MSDKDTKERAGRIRLLLMDCDGVLTDGRIYMTAEGEAMKVFDVKDGEGLSRWHRSGGRSGIITGRDSRGILEARCRELGIEFLRTGSKDKVRDMKELAESAGVLLEETAFIGDDLGDTGALKEAGFSIAVADAVDEVKQVAMHTTRKNGGRGAVREAIEFMLACRQ